MSLVQVRVHELESQLSNCRLESAARDADLAQLKAQLKCSQQEAVEYASQTRQAEEQIADLTQALQDLEEKVRELHNEKGK